MNSLNSKLIYFSVSSGKEICNSSIECCCGSVEGKICSRNKSIGNVTLLHGICDLHPDILYHCSYENSKAKLIVLCGGINGCVSYNNELGFDFCFD